MNLRAKCPLCISAFLGLALVLFLLPRLSSQNDATQDVAGNYVRDEMQRQHIPGLALLVSRGGNIVRAEGFGMANVELQVPVKPETVFLSANNSLPRRS